MNREEEIQIKKRFADTVLPFILSLAIIFILRIIFPEVFGFITDLIYLLLIIVGAVAAFVVWKLYDKIQEIWESGKL